MSQVEHLLNQLEPALAAGSWPRDSSGVYAVNVSEDALVWIHEDRHRHSVTLFSHAGHVSNPAELCRDAACSEWAGFATQSNDTVHETLVQNGSGSTVIAQTCSLTLLDSVRFRAWLSGFAATLRLWRRLLVQRRDGA
jgi:hypothetical protein